jgi:hypothetical protein
MALVIFAVCAVLAGCNDGTDIGMAPGYEPAASFGGHSGLAGVSLRTENAYYAEGTVRVLTFWENTSDVPITYGEPWQLERYEGGRWVTVNNTDTPGAFIAIGYGLQPGWSAKHTYGLAMFDSDIPAGRYRIHTGFHLGGPGSHYTITAEFAVTRNHTLLKPSELDFDDLENSRDITPYRLFYSPIPFARVPVRVYEHRHTFDAVVVFDGKEHTPIAGGIGGLGIASIDFLEDGDKQYLIYAYSREGADGEKQSFVSVFDLIQRAVVFRSEAFVGQDISVGYRSEEHYSVGIVRRFGPYGRGGGEALGSWGILAYRDGVFELLETDCHNCHHIREHCPCVNNALHTASGGTPHGHHP